MNSYLSQGYLRGSERNKHDWNSILARRLSLFEFLTNTQQTNASSGGGEPENKSRVGGTVTLLGLCKRLKFNMHAISTCTIQQLPISIKKVELYGNSECKRITQRRLGDWIKRMFQRWMVFCFNLIKLIKTSIENWKDCRICDSSAPNY